MGNATGVEITGPLGERFAEILTEEALSFLAELHRSFDGRRLELLDLRAQRQADLQAGGTLGFLPQTREVREGDWRVAEPAPGLEDRRVEITGPTDAKMTINALNSGAKVWLADHEDANTPLWENVVQGQLNLRDAVAGRLAFTSPEGKDYRLNDGPRPTIVVRPRGWHLPEKHIRVDGQPTSGSLTDFGLYFFHNHLATRPYFYLPKMESHLEARLWNEVFAFAEERFGRPTGTIRATVLIETFPAAFEMDEILYELREHSAGLNAGRWDYMFSVIKKFRTRGREFLLPDRDSVTMTVPFMRAYTELLVRTCHRRGAHAIGGMAAFIPSRRDPAVNKAAFEKVSADKTREAGDGFDGSWVAHPDLVPVCREIFDGVLREKPNQLDRLREDVHVTADDLLNVAATPGRRTETGLRGAVSVGVQYLDAWLRGTGAVAINNLMEDAATAEISRSQVWQWLHNGVVLDDTGEPVTKELVERIAGEELAKLGGDLAAARDLFMEVAVADDFVDFLTIPAYERMP
ncbi:malate synthase A [Dactylosporangium matsuzakiense]|uniref:Malate synthase n=1 Tax=Dactylosporangium matsuzakiense TaxID=53360 RepID=A0A9W6NS66_9ACTN|nr:malate synthase A [Dactylosporangium matsuzakiense]UWZ46960.1 malate synthase A [Dactylosporangium matsuzakiense]GLL06852.1 malate synthase [Dactylosporangium matsuzakiense]